MFVIRTCQYIHTSTLAGSCVDQDTGKVNEVVLKENLGLAISAYISRVDWCPMGNTTIKLYQGSTSVEHHVLYQ